MKHTKEDLDRAFKHLKHAHEQGEYLPVLEVTFTDADEEDESYGKDKFLEHMAYVAVDRLKSNGYPITYKNVVVMSNALFNEFLDSAEQEEHVHVEITRTSTQGDEEA